MLNLLTQLTVVEDMGFDLPQSTAPQQSYNSHQRPPFSPQPSLPHALPGAFDYTQGESTDGYPSEDLGGTGSFPNEEYPSNTGEFPIEDYPNNFPDYVQVTEDLPQAGDYPDTQEDYPEINDYPTPTPAVPFPTYTESYSNDEYQTESSNNPALYSEDVILNPSESEFVYSSRENTTPENFSDQHNPISPSESDASVVEDVNVNAEIQGEYETPVTSDPNIHEEETLNSESQFISDVPLSLDESTPKESESNTSVLWDDSLLPSAPEGVCGSGEFACRDGSGCVEEALVCDGLGDCDDGSDEEDCQLSEGESLWGHVLHGTPVKYLQAVVISQITCYSIQFLLLLRANAFMYATLMHKTAIFATALGDLIA